MDDGGQYDCEIEADGDLPISVSHRLDILLPPRVIVIVIIDVITITIIQRQPFLFVLKYTFDIILPPRVIAITIRLLYVDVKTFITSLLT